MGWQSGKGVVMVCRAIWDFRLPRLLNRQPENLTWSGGGSPPNCL
ncbi:hypothetical protein [Kingella sp. (in: b-proteobacteria)]|nr:hypothetical protein [Kingella sp. (in: b-proteobacteria)]MDO4656958.1 hypothetical protein [Kingella sp. (in: b-proteobacteria)]